MLLILFIILVVLVCGCDFFGDDSGLVINQSNLTDIKKETGITDEATLKKTGADPFMNCTAPDESEYSTKRFCLIDPRTGKPLFYCRPNEEKNKVVAVVRKGGIYDSEEIGSQASEYYEAVRKDLGIGNAGLKKFEGKTIAELDEFASSLYVDDDVGYVLLIGDDLPVADVNETSIEIWLPSTRSWNAPTGTVTFTPAATWRSPTYCRRSNTRTKRKQASFLRCWRPIRAITKTLMLQSANMKAQYLT